MDDMDQETRIMEPVPAEDEIRIVAATLSEDHSVLEEPVPGEHEIRITATNWLDEVSVEQGTMEWTAAQGDGSATASASTRPRVRHLFPVPEDADWEVRELDYDHYRNAGDRARASIARVRARHAPCVLDCLSAVAAVRRSSLLANR